MGGGDLFVIPPTLIMQQSLRLNPECEELVIGHITHYKLRFYIICDINEVLDKTRE